MNLVILIGSIILWGIVHSWLASLEAKKLLVRVFGKNRMRVYRLAYNIFAILSFAPVLLLVRLIPDQNLYNVPSPWLFLMVAGQGLSALMLLVGFLQTDALSFIGLRQLVELDELTGTLVTNGLYRLIRHPLYLFGLLFIWLTPVMTRNLLIVFISLTVYIFIGAYFEERKLLSVFGQAYAEYKSRTPMMIPSLIFRRNK